MLNSLPDPTADGHHDHDTWTYMTAAEVRGGMDGMLVDFVVLLIPAMILNTYDI